MLSKSKKRKIKVLRETPKYSASVLTSTLGEIWKNPELKSKIENEKSFRGKLVRQYFRELSKKLTKK